MGSRRYVSSGYELELSLLSVNDDVPELDGSSGMEVTLKWNGQEITARSLIVGVRDERNERTVISAIGRVDQIMETIEDVIIQVEKGSPGVAVNLANRILMIFDE